MYLHVKSTLLVFLFAVGLAYGQDPYYYSIDQAKGLPSNSVYDIFQDETGYMWFATDEGLCRYNGTTFKSYFSDQQTSKAGSSIAQDRYGRIWYSNFDSYLYYVANGKLHALKQKEPTGYLKYALSHNFVYVMGKNGVDVYRLKDLKFLKTITITGEYITCTYRVGEKYYLLGKYLYEITNGKLNREIPLPIDFYKSLGKEGLLMQQTPKGLLFMSKYIKNGFLFSNNTFAKTPDLEQTPYVQNVSANENGVWMCTPKGVYLWDMLQGYNKKWQRYFPQQNISFVYKDKNKNYWISTLNKGVLLVQDFANMLYQLPAKPTILSSPLGNSGNLTIAIATDILYQFNPTTSILTKKYEGESNHAINQLYLDSLTGYTMFTSNKFSFMDAQGKLAKQFLIAVKDVKPIDRKYFSFAASGYAGFFAINNHQKSIWDSVYHQHKVERNFGEAVLYSGLKAKSTVYNPTNKTIYYATNWGLLYRSLNGSSELSLNKGHLYLKMLVYGKGRVFALATNGKIYDINSKNKISLFALSPESKDKPVHKIAVLEDNLLVYTGSSIEAYNLDTRKWSPFLKLELDLEVYDCASYNDKLILATSKGVLLQNKKHNRVQHYPKFMIDEIMVNDSVWNNKAIEKLKYNQNNIVINYSQLAYAPNSRYPVYYNINNSKWQLLDAAGDALRLMSLSPGRYKINFKLAGVPANHQPKPLTFEIGKPFWLSNFFIIGVGCVFLSLVYLFYQHKITQNNKLNQQQLDRVNLEKNLNLSKLKAIKSQMNPHFFYNALNTIQSYILDSDKKQAVGYLSKFSALTRTILEMSENEYINLSEEIKMIGFYLDIEKARFNGNFEYTINLQHITVDEDMRIPSLLLQPYVENAIKHGLLHKQGEKKLAINLEKTSQTLRVTIDDNGIGRQRSAELNHIKSQKPPSFATEAIQNRIDLLNEGRNEKISVEYIDKKSAGGYATGTTVVIEIPIPSP